ILLRPSRQNSVGRAPAHPTVDGGRATHASSLGEADGGSADGHLPTTVAVELANHGGGLWRKFLCWMITALFEHDNIQPALAQFRSDDAAPGTRPDHYNVTR